MLCHIFYAFHLPLIQPTNKVYDLINTYIREMEYYFSRSHLRKIESRLTKASEDFVKQGFLTSTVRWILHQRITSRFQSLLDVATARGYGSIILGRSGHSPVGELLIGRVGKKVVEAVGTRAIWII